MVSGLVEDEIMSRIKSAMLSILRNSLAVLIVFLKFQGKRYYKEKMPLTVTKTRIGNGKMEMGNYKWEMINYG